VPAAPAASRAKDEKHTSVVTTGSDGFNRHSPRSGFNGSFVLSSVTGLSFPPSFSRIGSLRSLIAGSTSIPPISVAVCGTTERLLSSMGGRRRTKAGHRECTSFQSRPLIRATLLWAQGLLMPLNRYSDFELKQHVRSADNPVVLPSDSSGDRADVEPGAPPDQSRRAARRRSRRFCQRGLKNSIIPSELLMPRALCARRFRLPGMPCFRTDRGHRSRSLRPAHR
jgi:hypothetical protein